MDFQTAAKVGFGGGLALGTALIARGTVQDVKAGIDLSSKDSHYGQALKNTMTGSAIAGVAAIALMAAHKGEIRPVTELLGMAFLGSFLALPVSGSIAHVIGGAMLNRQAS